MIGRTAVASLFAICCAGLLLAPGEAAAGSRGRAIGRPLAIPGLPRAGALPLVRPGYVRPAVTGKPFIAGAPGGFRALRAGARRRGFGHGFAGRYGLPLLVLDSYGLNGLYGPYGPYFDPGTGTAALPPPAQDVVVARPTPPGEPVVVNGQVCFAQTYIVPSEAGGTRPVKVTRC
jgi:hypothetical protein